MDENIDRDNPLIIEEITMALPNLKNIFGDTVANVTDSLRQYVTTQLPKQLEYVASKNEDGKKKLDLVNAFNFKLFDVKPTAGVAAQNNDKAAPTQSSDAAAVPSSFHQ